LSYALDFKEITKTPIMDVAAMLGFKLTERQTEKGPQFVGLCPISQLMTPAAFKVTPGINRFHCFCAECRKLDKPGGDCIELVRRFRRLASHREAAAEIVRHFQGAGKAAENASSSSGQEASRNSAGFNPLDYLKSLDAQHDALADLDIMPETLIAFQAGYSSKGLNRGKLAVAWHNAEGVPIAFVGVALNGDLPQYLMPKGMPMPYWFGAHRVEEGEPLRILPHVFDVMRAHENGCENVICPLAPTDGDALNSLRALVLEKKLIVEF
jgi:hypothetical protein